MSVNGFIDVTWLIRLLIQSTQYFYFEEKYKQIKHKTSDKF